MNLLLLPATAPPRARRCRRAGPSCAPASTRSSPFRRRDELSRRAGGRGGEYLSCSLFSPVFEFAGHDVARQTAEACLTALFDPAAAGGGPPAEPAQEAQPASVSKRDFLRGRWHQPAASPPES